MQTGDYILSKATDLMTRRGVTSVTMDMIASSCGISKRTLYEIYPDKRTLVSQVVHDIYQAREKHMSQILDEVPNKLEAILRIYLDVREHVTKISEVFTNDVERLYPDILSEILKREQNYTQGLTRILAQGQDEGVFRRTHNTAILAAYFTISMRQMPQTLRLYPKGTSLSAALDGAFISFLRGVASAKGIEIIDKTFAEHNIEQ